MSEERLNAKISTLDSAHDPLDAVLDQALRSFANQAPREGFEARILARIDAEEVWQEKSKLNMRWLLPALSGLALACLAFMLVFVLQPEKKQIAEGGQLKAPQNSLATEHEAAIIPERVKSKNGAVHQTALPHPPIQNFEADQHRLILQLMNNAPDAIASLARMDRLENAELEQKEAAAPIKITPIQFDRIQIEPIDSTGNQPATETSSSDTASE
jgi:hypothetical protein